MSNPPKPQDLPTLVQLRSELKREQYRLTYGATLRSTAFFLVVVAAVAVLVATLMLPVLYLCGKSPPDRAGDRRSRTVGGHRRGRQRHRGRHPPG